MYFLDISMRFRYRLCILLRIHFTDSNTSTNNTRNVLLYSSNIKTRRILLLRYGFTIYCYIIAG